MDGLRPVGSEAIKDPDKKLARILEMSGIKKNTASPKINEGTVKARKTDETVLHTATASNGQVYGIVQEGKHVYVKEAKNGYFEYIGGIQNIREHSHKSYADALKHLNFMFKEINALTETKVGTNILREGYKLKVEPKAAPAPAPESTPEPAQDDFNFGGDTGDNSGDTDNLGLDTTEPATEPGAESNDNPQGDEETPTKKIQKLAGKLAQEIRDAKEGDIDDKLAKSVTNTVLSATLGLLNDDDKSEITNKIEDGEDVEADGQDFADFDAGAEPEGETESEPTNDGGEELKLEGNNDTLEESGLPEHNEPNDPSPMSKPGDHEVHEATEETDPYSLFETALTAIMEKAAKMGTMKELKGFMNETWGKIEGAYTNGKYQAMGKLAEAMDDVEEHNEPNDPSPMSKPGNHEVPLEEHNEPNDPSPMSKPGNHEVKKETALENPNQILDPSNNGISGMVANPATAFLQKGLKENEDKEICDKCGKKVCECGVTEEKVHHKNEAGMVDEAAEKEDINESLDFLRSKINEIRSRLNS